MVSGGLLFAALVVFGSDFAGYLALAAPRPVPPHDATAAATPTSLHIADSGGN